MPAILQVTTWCGTSHKQEFQALWKCSSAGCPDVSTRCQSLFDSCSTCRSRWWKKLLQLGKSCLKTRGSHTRTALKVYNTSHDANPLFLRTLPHLILKSSICKLIRLVFLLIQQHHAEQFSSRHSAGSHSEDLLHLSQVPVVSTKAKHETQKTVLAVAFMLNQKWWTPMRYINNE